MKCLESFVTECVESGYISHNKAPWLKYALEKRISSLIIIIPLLFVGTIVSSFNAAIAFYISCRSVRSYTNGIHAKSLTGCFLGSLTSEICFLGILRHLLTFEIKSTIMLLSVVLIWLLAPYNHPNMALSEEEIRVCALKAKKRSLFVAVITLVLDTISMHDMAEGALLGLVMTSLMLTISYFPKGGCFNENE